MTTLSMVLSWKLDASMGSSMVNPWGFHGVPMVFPENQMVLPWCFDAGLTVLTRYSDMVFP